MGKELPALHGADHAWYGPDPIPDVIKLTSADGSVVIDHTAHPYTYDLSAVLAPQVEWLADGGTASITSLLGGNSGFVSFAHSAGATLMDFTNPVNPAFVEAGLYYIQVQVSTGELINVGAACVSAFSISTSGHNTMQWGTSLGYTRNSRAGSMFGHGLRQVAAGETFSMSMLNDDSITHTFAVQTTSYVQRLD